MKVVFASVLAVALACSAAAAGAPQSTKALAAPTGLRAFVYRADEAIKPDHTYALMPAFAWNATRAEAVYELQLATSRMFSDATLLYDRLYNAPVASIQLQVPWMTGRPYALWVRVRVLARGRTSPWGMPFGFNTQWQQLPEQRQAPQGLIRWSTVEGATAYEVWFLNGPQGYNTNFQTLTNVADEREYWTFHPAEASIIQWRVRAVRLVQSAALPNGIAVARYGPYSKVYTTPTASTALSPTPIKAVAAVSDVDSTPEVPSPHQLTPGLAWTGTETAAGGYGSDSLLWRAYVFSDQQCVNPVMTGTLLGGPAWAPRDADPLAMPATVQDLIDAENGKFLGFGSQGKVFMADGAIPAPAESTTAGGSADSGSPTPPPNGASSSNTITSRLVSLPDNGWPQGRYWWTVVPVAIHEVVADPKKGPSPGDKLEFHDLVLPQDACAAGQVWPFGVQSAPLTTTSETPYASGVVNGTRVVSAAGSTPSFEELPLITWQPALAAVSYEIQLSKHLYPWVAVRKQTSVVTSAVLKLSKRDLGIWYYRVRGVNPNLRGAGQKLAWSKPVAIRISGDHFIVVK